MERRVARERKRITGFGIVKAVTSGDSLILMGGTARGGLLSEKHITLSGVLAPKIALRNGVDAPFAFASREFLRSRVIGKRVKFFINHTQEGVKERNYADVQTQEKTDLAEELLRHGWVAVKMPNGDKIFPDKQRLIDIQNDAKAHKRGQWNTALTNQVRDVNYSPDAQTLLAETKGQAIPAIVDFIREGHFFRLELVGPHLAHNMISLHLAGVQCPRTPRSDSKDQPEPFAAEAKFYSEARLLHRPVHVRLLGIDKQGNFFGSIEFPRGNISVNLLENGLGKYVPWSAALTPEASKLAAAQQLAQSRRANLWVDFDPAANSEQALPEYQATVVFVHSGQQLTVETTTGKHERKKISLSSIRCPQIGYKDMPDEAFAMEAREFVRSKLIGKRVLVQTDYQRGNAKTPPSCTVSYCTGTDRAPNTDLAVGLVSRGLGKVINHSASEPRSRNYGKLLLAEEEATRKHLGIMNTRKPLVATPIIDLTIRERRDAKSSKNAEEKTTTSENKKESKGKGKKSEGKKEARNSGSKARQFLRYMEGKSLNGVVEHAYSGTRYKVYIASENVFISLMIAGIRSPQYDADGDAKQIANVATTYVQSKLLQRSIRVAVQGIDQRDNFIGTVFLGKLNFAIHLVSHGYASVNGFSASKTDHKKELFAAEDDAKAKKVGMWENWVKPATPVPSDDEDDAEETKTEPVRGRDETLAVTVTEITDANNFYVQLQNDRNIPLVQAAMDAFVAGDASSDLAPAKDMILAGLFSDGTWHRVKIEGQNRTNQTWRVIFIDYGNRTELKTAELRVLSKELQTVPACARACTLAGVQSSFQAEYKMLSTTHFGELAFEQNFSAKVECKDRNNKLHVTLVEAKGSPSINDQLVRQGLVRVVERPERGIPQSVIASLREAEAVAKVSNLVVWEHGDVSDSDGETDSKRNDGKAPRRFKN
jgi:staphylococcal nuclease domain-containing protein 1